MTDISVMQAAADWLVRLSDAPEDEALVAAWLQWCEESPDHLSAFKRAQTIWQAALPGLPLSDPGAEARPASQRRWWAAAAAVLLSAVCALWIASRHNVDPGQQSYSTPIAGRGLSVLPDGSRVELGAGSRITTRYTAATRGVTVDAGEAFFSVKKDPQRPFVVTVGDLQVVAVGTAFNVRRGGDQVVVAVEEGRVRVAEISGAGPDLAAVAAGEQAVYGEKAHRLAKLRIKPADAASWRDGILRYEHEPLSAVAADLNRYSTRKILIEDPSVAQLPFTGTVLVSHIDDALHAFTDVFPLTLVEQTDSVELRRLP